jgi:hypothetical protein
MRTTAPPEKKNCLNFVYGHCFVDRTIGGGGDGLVPDVESLAVDRGFEACPCSSAGQLRRARLGPDREPPSSPLAVRLRRWSLPLTLGGLALPLAGCVIDTALAHTPGSSAILTPIAGTKSVDREKRARPSDGAAAWPGTLQRASPLCEGVPQPARAWPNRMIDLGPERPALLNGDRHVKVGYAHDLHGRIDAPAPSSHSPSSSR